MCHHAKFCENQPNGFDDRIAFFIFKMATDLHTGFSDFEIFCQLSNSEG